MTLIAMIGIIIVGSILYSAMDLGKISRINTFYGIELETMAKIAERLVTVAEDTNIMNYTLQKYSPPDNNANLKNCIMAGVPSSSEACQNVSLEIYMPGNNGSDVRVIGSEHKPFHVDMYGEECLRGETESEAGNCAYSIISKCQFECPAQQTSCALVKIMTCSINIESIPQSLARRFTFRRKSTVYFSTYALRISNDLKSFDAIH